MRLKIVSLFILMFLSIAASHVLAQQHDTSAPQADSAIRRALDHYHAGKLNEAAGLLRGFVVSQPDSALINQAYYYLARIHRDLDDPVTAIGYLEKMAGKVNSPAGILLQSELLLKMGDTVRAIDQLLQSDTQNWSLQERQERYLTLAEGLLALDEPHKALYFYQQALVVEGDESPRDVLTRIYTLQSDRFDEADLAEAAFMYRDKPVAYLAMLQLGWRALAADQKDLAQKWASAAMAAPAGFAYRDEVLALLSQLTDQTQLQRAIGVLLPLSGRYAAFGQRVQRGMELAQETFRPHIPVRFIFRDTAGDETVAAQQVAELAISDRVMGIAGPLVGNAALGAVRRANQEHTPLLTMSQKEGLAASSLYVFRNSLTPQLQVRTLINYAMDVRGFSQFGIMSPQTRQGEQFAEIFRKEVTRRGGKIVAEQSYLSDQTDFRHQIRLLQGLNPNTTDEGEENNNPPPFQALFLPDYADRIKLIAPQLAFYGLEGVQLLGPNGWNDADLPRQTREFVEGAVFTDGFFRHSDYPFVQEFVEHYFSRYGEDPTILEAQGYDIAGILLTLLNDSSVRNREDLRRALAQLQNYPGVTGATRFDLIGEADKVLFLLQVQKGAIVQIN
ncbi:MAG: penicillin-binding protein activator [Desulfuromonadales bacterium]|nr:penicillin-binding protein activator [Desulfuromonadales bacterium]